MASVEDGARVPDSPMNFDDSVRVRHPERAEVEGVRNGEDDRDQSDRNGESSNRNGDDAGLPPKDS